MHDASLLTEILAFVAKRLLCCRNKAFFVNTVINPKFIVFFSEKTGLLVSVVILNAICKQVEQENSFNTYKLAC